MSPRCRASRPPPARARRVNYTQGLPTDTSLTPIPSADLTPAYASTGYGGTYTGTLTAPETGTYVLAFQNPGSYTVTNLSLTARSSSPTRALRRSRPTRSRVDLQAGQTYTLELSGGGPSANLSWATPSDLAPDIAQAVSAAKSASTAVVVVSDDTESEAADRAEPQPALSAERADLRRRRRQPTHRGGRDRRRRARGDALAQPGRRGARRLVPRREQRHRAGVGAVRPHRPGRSPARDLPADLSQVPASSPNQFPGVNGQVDYSEGIDVGYRYYDAHNETPLFPFGYGLSYTKFSVQPPEITPSKVNNADLESGGDQLPVQRAVEPPEVTVSATSPTRATLRAPTWRSCTWATRRWPASLRAS